MAAGAKFWCRCKDMLRYQLKETKIESLTQITSSEWRLRVPRWRKKAAKFAKSLWKTGGFVTGNTLPNCDPPHACVSRAVQRGLLPPHSNELFFFCAHKKKFGRKIHEINYSGRPGDLAKNGTMTRYSSEILGDFSGKWDDD